MRITAKATLPEIGHSRSIIVLLLVSIVFFQPGASSADPVAVRHTEGTFHGFLVLRTTEGKTLAAGDLIEITEGDRVTSRLIFRFKDGSIDDESTVFTQHLTFRLVTDHHVQKGPAFPHAMDVSIHASTGQIQIRSMEGGKDKTEMYHLNLPPDLANGIMLTLMKNIPPDAKETKVSFVAANPKPRLVKLAITPQGEDTFSAAGWRHGARRYVVKVELGGLTGIVAPLIGEQPRDTYVWVVGGDAPAFVKFEGPLYLRGPLWSIELTSPVW